MFEAGQPALITQAQVLVADTLRPGQQRIRELLDFHAGVTRHVFEPLGRIARCVLDFQHFHAAQIHITLQHRVHVGWVAGRSGAGGACFGQRYRIFERELGAAANGKVRRVGCITHQHHRHPPVRQIDTVHPGATHNPREPDPVGRAAQMFGVADQRVAVQVAREQPLAKCHTVFLAHVFQSMGSPDLLRGLHDEGRSVLVELVGMGLEPAMFRLLEGKGESVEGLVRTEPHKAAQACIDVGLVGLGVPGADAAVESVAGDHQVGLVLAGQCLIVRYIGLEHQFHAHRQTALLQDIEQVLAPDAAKPMTARTHAAALEKYLDIVPVVERVPDLAAARRVGHAQVVQRLVGQHNAPAKGVEWLVPLDYHDPVRRILQLHEQTEIQPRRPAAYAQYIHEAIVYA